MTRPIDAYKALRCTYLRSGRSGHLPEDAFIYLLSRYLGLQCFQLTLEIMLRWCQASKCQSLGPQPLKHVLSGWPCIRSSS